MILTFDTNVLIDMMLLPEQTLNELIELLDTSNYKIFIPHTVNLEFFKHFSKVSYDNNNFQKKIKSDLFTNLNNIKQGLDSEIRKKQKLYKNLPFKDITDKYTEEFNKFKDKLKEIFKDDDQFLFQKKDYSELKNFVTKHSSSNKYYLSEHQKLQCYIEADYRYKYGFPPGFKDSKKSKYNDKYNDYIIWNEILNFLKLNKNNYNTIIFLQNEKKEDFWIYNNGKKEIHPILIEDISHVDDSISFNMLSFIDFIKNKYINIPHSSVEDIIIDIEIKNKLTQELEYSDNSLINYMQSNVESILLRTYSFLFKDFVPNYTYLGTSILDIDIDNLDIPHEYFTIDYINSCSNSNSIIVEIDGSMKNITVHGHALEYISKDYNKPFSFFADLDLDLSLSLPVNKEFYFNENILNNINYNDAKFDFYNLIVNDFQRTYSYTESFDCPQCGRTLPIEKDALNGFCVDCTIKYNK